MAYHPNGELVPEAGGDPIPLLRETMTLGRKRVCDICLDFPNISSHHCDFVFKDGYWYVRDCNSRNGTKVNGLRVISKVLIPGDELHIGKRKYTIKYTTPADRRIEELMDEDIFGKSLLQRAGLQKEDIDDEKSDDMTRGGRSAAPIAARTSKPKPFGS